MEKYYNQEARFDEGKLIVTDKAVAEYTKRHMRLRDRRNIRKVTECAMLSFSILSHSIEAPKREKWFYYDDLRKNVDLWS